MICCHGFPIVSPSFTQRAYRPEEACCSSSACQHRTFQYISCTSPVFFYAVQVSGLAARGWGPSYGWAGGYQGASLGTLKVSGGPVMSCSMTMGPWPKWHLVDPGGMWPGWWCRPCPSEKKRMAAHGCPKCSIRWTICCTTWSTWKL